MLLIVRLCRLKAHRFEKAQKQQNFGNARYVRNLLEKIEMELAQRVISDGTDNCIIKLFHSHFLFIVNILIGNNIPNTPMTIGNTSA